ncbi:putative regulatory protein [Pyrococcus sp. ST04]|nr:putative regulatory protein [Pyrococcus sp. ST04]
MTGNPRWLLKILVDKWSEKEIVAMEKPIIVPKNPNSIIFGDPSKLDSRYRIFTNIIGMHRRDVIQKIGFLLEKAVIVDYEEKYFLTKAINSKLGKIADYLIAYKMETLGFEKLDIIKIENGKITDKTSYVRKK